MQNGLDLKIPDEQLVDNYKNGNYHSLGKLYERYFKKVYHKCLSFTRRPDEANDMAQDILMKAMENISSFRGNSKFATWLFAITKNHCITYSRSKRSIYFEDIYSNENILDELDDLSDRELYEQREVELDNMLYSVRDTERKMLVLKYQKNYSIKDLQKELNLSASAVKMRLQRARNKVQKLYEKSDIFTATA
jgi:RNA polymerase sigma factor (sigma-70 family)